jgi:acyl-[acyl-carrier-protein]-phospholipid O-acyltransferase / long-chain-fatty-acid--[acyl-carrier-protein] ligase
MEKNIYYHLLKTNRFLPLFVTQFFNAYNDNAFKNALVILITFKLTTNIANEQFLIALIGGIFILPFFLFSANAGQIADKFEKSTIIRIIKFAEIIFMLIAGIGFYFNQISLLMVTLFFLGMHSTFFGPIKYAILPEHLKKEELLAGNGLIEAGTFIAILIGQVFGGSLILTAHGTFSIPLALEIIALLGFISCLFIPRTARGQPDLVLSFNIFRETWRIVSITRQNKDVFLAILGISWFWFIGATFLTQFPTFTKKILSSSAPVFTLFLTIFSIGIGIGSLLCNSLLKGKITVKYVPISLVAMSIFIFDIYMASPSTLATTSHLASFSEFFHKLMNLRILIDLFLMTICGGLFVVPLYALIQSRSEEAVRSRVIACNNIINAFFMVISALFIMLLTSLHFTIPQLFLIVAILNLFVAIFICKILPETVIHSFINWFLRFLYKVEVKGLENYHQAGKRMVIIPNHTSFLDGVLLAAFIPYKLSFAVNTVFAKKWWLRAISKIINIISLDPTEPLAVKSLIKLIREDHQVVIFPEGRITVTGSLMKIYEGPGIIADQAKAALLPIRIDGAQYTPFSRLRGKVKIRWFPKITLTILPPCQITLSEEIKGRERRHILGRKLYDVMSNMMFESSDFNKTLFQSLLEAKAIHSGKHVVLEDIQRRPLNYRNLIRSCFVLSCYWQKHLQPSNNVGILLPNIIGNVVSFFSLQAIHRVPVMLNFTFGSKDLISTCYASGIQDVITSHQFISHTKLEPLQEQLLQANIKIHYLEDFKTHLNFKQKVLGYIKSYLPHFFYRPNPSDVNKPAVILFTSGSEGAPKGVALSHKNLQANRFQLSARIDFSAKDIILNALPMFHSFGLSSGTILPLLFGIKIFLYPSPLHYRIVPELIYDINATITFGTDTFLRGYGKFANPYDFYSIRYVLAGAEKLKDETKSLWNEKFGIRILEGYGVTETSPVLSTNTPMHYRAHSVGRLLPGIDYRIEPVPGIEHGGRLIVRGPNVMLGYLFADQPQKIIPLKNDWYDTGDIVEINEDGFIQILGRAKRFAKIAGEMVSLTAVEHYLAERWPEYQHAIVSVPDQQKGELLVLFTTNSTLTREEILKYTQQQGISELQVPKKIIHLEKMPLLGTGKINYEALKSILGRSS